MRIKTLNLIITTLVVIATIIIAILIKPEEPTAMFYVNATVCIVIELLCINSILTLSKSQNFTQQNIATARQILTLAMQCLFWMLLFSLLITRYVDTKWYYVGYIVIIIINIVIALIVHTAGKTQIKINREVAENVVQQNTINIDLQFIKIQISKKIETCDTDPIIIENAMQVLNLLIEKLRISPANTSVDIRNKTDNYLSQIMMTCNNMQTTEDCLQLTALLNETIEYINVIKRY